MESFEMVEKYEKIIPASQNFWAHLWWDGDDLRISQRENSLPTRSSLYTLDNYIPICNPHLYAWHALAHHLALMKMLLGCPRYYFGFF